MNMHNMSGKHELVDRYTQTRKRIRRYVLARENVALIKQEQKKKRKKESRQTQQSEETTVHDQITRDLDIRIKTIRFFLVVRLSSQPQRGSTLQRRGIVLHVVVLLGEVMRMMTLHLMKMSGLAVCRRIEQRRRRQRSLIGIVGSAMCLIKVKPRRFLVEEVVLRRLLLLRMGMECPAVVLEILARQRMASGLFQSEMLLTQLLELLSAELLGVV